jgi:hypothetical protein
MREAIHAALRPVRGRQQLLFVLRCVVAGLLAGAAAGLAVGAARALFDLPVSPAARAGLFLAGPLAGLVVGVAVRRSWHDAAAAVDARYGLKDRAVTALAFADLPAPTELQSLQIADAMDHLRRANAAEVVPIKAPRLWSPAAAAGAVAAALLFWPAADRQAEAGPLPPSEEIVRLAGEEKERLAALEKKLADTTQDMEDEKADEEKKGLQEMIQRLMQKVEELTQPGTNEQEALAKLSEMQAEMQALSNQLNVAAMDGQLSALATALAASQPFEGAGKALQDGKLEKAAKELEKIEEVKLTPKEEKALEEQLKALAKQMGDAGQGSLSQAVSELAESLKGGKGGVGKASRQLAKAVYNAAKRKKLRDLLQDEIEELKEAKSNSLAGASGGPKGKTPEKSTSPTNTWGRGTSGNIEGEKTRLNGKRNEVQLTGTPGDEGPSDVETTATPEARQQAARQYKEKVERFRKEMEAALEHEPLPLTHRSMIKKYFEMIRPQAGEMADKKDDPAPRPSGDAGKK